ncbi:MAG TPA: hypothetical protein PK121_02450 [Candidatus Pacearchaeota archaeon]|nr:hypothetical protein [Candidatus Pacearchaeota archaeon]
MKEKEGCFSERKTGKNIISSFIKPTKVAYLVSQSWCVIVSQIA